MNIIPTPAHPAWCGLALCWTFTTHPDGAPRVVHRMVAFRDDDAHPHEGEVGVDLIQVVRLTADGPVSGPVHEVVVGPEDDEIAPPHWVGRRYLHIGRAVVLARLVNTPVEQAVTR